MSTEVSNSGIDEELMRQLTLEYPEACQKCDNVASAIFLLMVRGNRSEEEIRKEVRDHAEYIRSECTGPVEVTDTGCFGDPTVCYLNTEDYLESGTIID